MNKERGFTLIELMITLLVAAILLGTAVPAFTSFMHNNRIVAANNELINAIATARNEAIRRRDVVTLCASANLTACSGANTWETGWLIMSDRNGDATLNGADAVLRVWEALPNGITLATQTVPSTNIQFDRLGAPSTNETFLLTNPDCKAGQVNRERTIALIGTGNVGSTRTNCP